MNLLRSKHLPKDPRHGLAPLPFDPVAYATERERYAAERAANPKKGRKGQSTPLSRRAARENLKRAKAGEPFALRCLHFDCLRSFNATQGNRSYCSEACRRAACSIQSNGLTPQIVREHLALQQRRAAGIVDRPVLTRYALALVTKGPGERDDYDSLLLAASSAAAQHLSALADDIENTGAVEAWSGRIASCPCVFRSRMTARGARRCHGTGRPSSPRPQSGRALLATRYSRSFRGWH